MNANKQDDKELVVFRVLKTEPQKGEVIALFPWLPADVEGKFCQSFMHIGQHGGADYEAMIADSRPALMKEYGEIKAELEGRGYDLFIVTHSCEGEDRQIRKNRVA